MLLRKFCATALEHMDIFHRVDNLIRHATRPLSGLDFAFCTTALTSFKLGGLLLNFSPGAASHTRPADSLRGGFLDQITLSSNGSSAVLSVLKGNLILVASGAVFRTERDLQRRVPASFSFDFSLPCRFCSAQC